MKTSTRFLSMAVAMSLAMSMTGCVCTTGNSGDVTFTWTMDGSMCGMVPDVQSVVIAIPGHTLQNGGVFPCVTSGTAGITLLNFGPGTYSYTIEARNTAGTKLFAAAGKFAVNGDVTVPVDLKSDASTPAYAYVTWTFPATAASNGRPSTCAQASASRMVIQVDGQPLSGTYSCADGQVSPGVGLTLTPGQHQIDIAAAVVSGSTTFYLFRKISTVTAVAGRTAANEFSLDWNAGSINLAWSLSAGTCSQAGVNAVDVYVVDMQSMDQVLLPDASYEARVDAGGRPYYRFNCLQPGGMGARMTYLYPGSYRIQAQAVGTAGIYQTNINSLPMATVVAGNFNPTATAISLAR